MSRLREEAGALGSLEWAWAARTCQGEIVSGDTVAVRAMGGRLHLAVVDVLGHGPDAHAVATRVDEFLVERDLTDAGAALEALHHRILGSLGASAGLGTFDPETGVLQWAGVGNTVARRLGANPARLVSRDGILGQFLPSVEPSTLTLGASDVVVLYTDGLPSGFDQEAYPQLRYHGAQTICRTLLKRFGRATDDATVLTLRWTP